MTHREAGRTSHVTVVTQRGGRRINDRVGARENLCGADPTLHDQLLSDVKRMKPADRDEWVTCAACRSKARL